MLFQMLQILEELGNKRGTLLSYYAFGKHLQTITVGCATCSYFRATVTDSTLTTLITPQMYGSSWKTDQSLQICKNQNRAIQHDPIILQCTHKHTSQEIVSLILWKFPNTRWCVDWLKRERRRREEMMGKEGKRSSSIKSPYVYSLRSIVHPGGRHSQARVWAG